MRFSFVHAADLHLDSPFRGLGSSTLADTLRDATLAAFDTIIDRAIAVQAPFVILAGDIYDGPEYGLRAQVRFLAGLERLAERGIRVFIAHGNHDPKGGRWDLIRRWPRGVHVFQASNPELVEVRVEGELLARVQGVSYGERAETRNLAERFRSAPNDALHVAVLHTNVGGDANHHNYAPCSLADLTGRGVGYWALGHVHRHQILSRAPSWVVYPGCTQGRSFAPGEVGPKGAVVVDVEDGRVVRVTPFETDSARFFEVPLDVSATLDIGNLHQSLRSAAIALRAQHPRHHLVLRARLTGRSAVHEQLRDLGARQDLLTELTSDHAYGGSLTWTELLDDSAPPIDLEALRSSEDLRGALIETADLWREQGLPPELLADLRRFDLDVDRAHLEAALLDALTLLESTD